MLKDGEAAPPHFNVSLAWFPPKGEVAEDRIEIIRSPLDTRPLSGKNTDNKAIVLANVLTLEPQYKEIVHKSQGGFVSGRNFLRNLVDIDAAGRIFSSKFEGASEHVKRIVKNFPVISSNDSGAAFPSIIQAWIWLVLRYRKLPARFIMFFQAICRDGGCRYHERWEAQHYY